MKAKNLLKKIIGCLLAISMVLGYIPISAKAEEPVEEPLATVQEEEELIILEESSEVVLEEESEEAPEEIAEESTEETVETQVEETEEPKEESEEPILEESEETVQEETPVQEESEEPEPAEETENSEESEDSEESEVSEEPIELYGSFTVTGSTAAAYIAVDGVYECQFIHYKDDSDYVDGIEQGPDHKVTFAAMSGTQVTVTLLDLLDTCDVSVYVNGEMMLTEDYSDYGAEWTFELPRETQVDIVLTATFHGEAEEVEEEEEEMPMPLMAMAAPTPVMATASSSTKKLVKGNGVITVWPLGNIIQKKNPSFEFGVKTDEDGNPIYCAYKSGGAVEGQALTVGDWLSTSEALTTYKAWTGYSNFDAFWLKVMARVIETGYGSQSTTSLTVTYDRNDSSLSYLKGTKVTLDTVQELYCCTQYAVWYVEELGRDGAAHKIFPTSDDSVYTWSTGTVGSPASQFDSEDEGNKVKAVFQQLLYNAVNYVIDNPSYTPDICILTSNSATANGKKSQIFVMPGTVEVKQGYLTLVKSSAKPECTTNNSSYSLTGAQYGVYSDSTCKTKVGTLTTTASGSANTLELPLGTYYVKETKAPTNYTLDSTVYTVEITADNITTATAQKLSVTDEPIMDPVGILLKKTNAQGTEEPQKNG